jgi:putative molybdopterin biosynthesis protein
VLPFRTSCSSLRDAVKNARPPLDLERLKAEEGLLLTTFDVARLLRVHPKHVYRLLRRGLPGHRVGGEWRFNADQVLAWSGAVPSDRLTHGQRRAPAAATGESLPPLLAANGDIAVERLLKRMAETGPSLGLLTSDRGTGLELLRRGEVLATGCHGSVIPGALGDSRLVFVHLVERSIGFALRSGVRWRGLPTLRRVRVASRPETAGVRAPFDDELRRQGIDPRALHERAAVLPSHCEVVCAVARGDADVGLTSEAWARRVGLTFVPLCRENYGILVRASALGDPRIVHLCGVTQSASFRRDVGRAPGYEARRAGTIYYEPPKQHRLLPPAS